MSTNYSNKNEWICILLGLLLYLLFNKVFGLPLLFSLIFVFCSILLFGDFIYHIKEKIEIKKKEKIKADILIAKPSKKWIYTPEELFKSEYISFSRLDCYNTCPKKFEIIYLQNKKQQYISRNLLKGKLFHKLIELYTKHNIKTFPECLKNKNELNNIFSYYNLAINTINTELPSNININLYRIFTENELTNLLSNFIKLNQNRDIHILFKKTDPSIAKINNRFLLSKPEFSVKVNINNYIFFGIIDRLDIYTNSCVLIDYKTGKQYDSDQLDFYLYLLKHLSEFRDKQFYIEYQYLKSGNYKRIARIYNAYFESYLWGTIEKITLTKDFKPNISWKCKFCGVKHYCSEYKNS